MTLVTAQWLRLLASTLLASSPTLPAGLKAYPTRYYTIHTDLDEDTVREVSLRLTRMAEEYQTRTQAFTGKIHSRLPFYLFRDPADYRAAGGPPGSAGVYTGDRLMAVARSGASANPWSIIQHEGWHQFVDAVIGGDIPVWVNEGMAVYFQVAVFTGDGFLTGVIPQHRLARVRRRLKAGRFQPLSQMMTLKRGPWNRQMSSVNYDQAWSMVHFLAHAHNGRFRLRFDDFLQDVSLKGLSWERAWLNNFDADIDAFETEWKSYWERMEDHPTQHLYDEAVVATLTSYLARAYSREQTFADVSAFLDAARDASLKAHPDDWLPPSLLRETLDRVEQTGAWSLVLGRNEKPSLVCTSKDGAQLVGTFFVSKGRVTKISVNRSKTRP